MSGDVKISVKNCFKVFGPNPGAMMPLIRNGVSKSELLEKHGHVIGLHDINVDMRAGEITVIMGLSGSGKSTLIRHLNGLIVPTAGQILMDGRDITELSGRALLEFRRSRVSMVFQNFALMPHLTVLENVGLAKKVCGKSKQSTRADARRWIDRLGLSGFEGRYPHQLSGGMQQRVGIARALTSDAGVLLMDEAFSALDPLTRADMQDLLIELQRELFKTIVFITHDLEEALKIADHIVILKDGKIVQQGAPQSIILNPCDEYIERFVNDINRARVLRVRSVMQPAPSIVTEATDVIDANETLESAMVKSEGDPDRTFTVTDAGAIVGTLAMRDLIRAIVPRSVRGAPQRGAEAASGAQPVNAVQTTAA
ncbi:quaternary amine ABC transporter ATP-binding protein [Paraburkholderia phenoliruptrix]|uniref:Quaternary amine transport ATP-binding protein n=1 Tax=Paraburkholderia phenoliruptrix TaxID=252970 RepID=A0A6J5K6D3_9BURK|nr:betaine/proline/choline family ABC transporter ATP-binding protein [Paraburkholderia phenoliruptrix]MDR6388315.1 glycine betaine/proline transport system ATP-binding protein [Paraburkholderia phenoliruptrix]CAB4049579.1 Vitamin B12 import ATP-binding protein BtuD [Paraburkholderia phenoliruptrix]